MQLFAQCCKNQPEGKRVLCSSPRPSGEGTLPHGAVPALRAGMGSLVSRVQSSPHESQTPSPESTPPKGRQLRVEWRGIWIDRCESLQCGEAEAAHTDGLLAALGSHNLLDVMDDVAVQLRGGRREGLLGEGPGRLTAAHHRVVQGECVLLLPLQGHTRVPMSSPEGLPSPRPRQARQPWQDPEGWNEEFPSGSSHSGIVSGQRRTHRCQCSPQPSRAGTPTGVLNQTGGSTGWEAVSGRPPSWPHAAGAQCTAEEHGRCLPPC